MAWLPHGVVSFVLHCAKGGQRSQSDERGFSEHPRRPPRARGKLLREGKQRVNRPRDGIGKTSCRRQANGAAGTSFIRRVLLQITARQDGEKLGALLSDASKISGITE